MDPWRGVTGVGASGALTRQEGEGQRTCGRFKYSSYLWCAMKETHITHMKKVQEDKGIPSLTLTASGRGGWSKEEGGMFVGGDGCVEVPSSSSLYVWCVWGVGRSQAWGAKQPTKQASDYPSHLPNHQSTNHTTAQQEMGGRLLDVLKREICNLLEPTCSGGSSNNWLESHWNIAGTTYWNLTGTKIAKV